MTHYSRGALAAPAGIIALSFLLVHCQSGEVTGGSKKTRDPITDSDGNQNGDESGDPNNGDGTSSGSAPVPREDPMLVFSFDGKSLHARIRANVANGAKVSATVFGAKYGEDWNGVNCDALPSVDMSGARTEGNAVVVDVPSNTSFLASRLDSTDKRTVIHGCLTDAQGQVVFRVSTSLMNAWDADPAGIAATPRIFHGVEAYVNKCIDELGEIPMFEGGKTFDCDDPTMQIVPITATDTSGRVTTISNANEWPLSAAQQSATQRCDRPAWLDYGQGNSQCAPFTRIGRYTNSKGTRYVVICRRYTAVAPTDPNYDIVGVIAHNPESGKTCWFNNHLDGTSNNGTKIQPPNTPSADRWWMNSDEIRAQGCPSCHDSDPFIHTPWMDQSLDNKGKLLVPRIGDDSAYTLATKYSSIANESFMGTDATSQAAWRQPQHLTNIGSCGNCHRIGTGSTLQQFAQRSVGDSSDRDFQTTWLTSAFRTFTKLHWMPTTPMTEQTWASSADAQSMNLIAGCISNPGSCAKQDVPR